MIIFYSDDCDGRVCHLGPEEAAHCVRVLRHRCGDEVDVIDGRGTFYRCRLTSVSPSACDALVLESVPDWGSHPYKLCMAVCPTKNNERFEVFAEKATEIGVDCIVPVIGEHSERKVFKGERLRRILLSACKQSLKAKIPELDEAVSVRDFILSVPSEKLKLIACCFEDEAHPRRSIKEVLEAERSDDVVILIGPEGDFSKEELSLALANGFVPVHLGSSRLRTETAAIAAVSSVYLNFL